MIVVVAPHDTDIPKVKESQEKLGFEVITYSIKDSAAIFDDLVILTRPCKYVDIFFPESGWGSIPKVHRHPLEDKLMTLPNVHHLIKANKIEEATSPPNQ